MANIGDILKSGGTIALKGASKLIGKAGELASAGARAALTTAPPVIDKIGNSLFSWVGEKSTALKKKEFSAAPVTQEPLNLPPEMESPSPSEVSPDLSAIKDGIERLNTVTDGMAEDVHELTGQIAAIMERDRQEGDIQERINEEPPTIQLEPPKEEGKKLDIGALTGGLLGGAGLGGLQGGVANLLSTAMGGALPSGATKAITTLLSKAVANPAVLAIGGMYIARNLIREWNPFDLNKEEMEKAKERADESEFSDANDGGDKFVENPDDHALQGAINKMTGRDQYGFKKEDYPEPVSESALQSKTLEQEQVKQTDVSFADKSTGISFLGFNAFQDKTPANRMTQKQVQALSPEDRARYDSWLASKFSKEEVALIQTRLNGGELSEEQQAFEATNVKPETYFGETYISLFGDYEYNHEGADKNLDSYVARDKANALPSATAKNFMSAGNKYADAASNMATNANNAEAAKEKREADMIEKREEQRAQEDRLQLPPVQQVFNNNVTQVIGGGGQGGPRILPIGGGNPGASGLSPANFR